MNEIEEKLAAIVGVQEKEPHRGRDGLTSSERMKANQAKLQAARALRAVKKARRAAVKEAKIDSMPPLTAEAVDDFVIPPVEFNDPLAQAAYEKEDKRIKAENEAKALAVFTATTSPDIVLCFEQNGYRCTLPLTVAKERFAQGQIIRYERL